MTLLHLKIIKCQLMHWQQNGWQKVNDARTVWSAKSGDGSRAAGSHASCEQSINHFILRKNKMKLKGSAVCIGTEKNILFVSALIHVCMHLVTMNRNNRSVEAHIVLQPISFDNFPNI